ncbi:hypothetical protein [Streptomyces sp. TLI_185]|uniref:hypothetical protein n=1 Tax=Streptomyces sp. TLI_185 TaxID=2485151 RepID=UPI000F4EE7F7|nr:hypothetical protein [Streptomyces sp. TLI_185]RPF37415.1 hypothetical protein EDD92_7493 [Streptomyces sp. TLI_185]
MQWTDKSGGAYGEDPYGGAGDAYAYGHEAGGGITTDTATFSWDPAHLARWTPPAGDFAAMEPEPWITGMPHPGTGQDPLATTEWNSPYGDVITVLPPDLEPSGRPVPDRDTPENDPARPVFVDASGRRQRRVRRTARLLLIPTGGYVALLISTMLGGPTISAPFVPSPDTPHPTTPSATAPDSPSGAGPAAKDATSGAADGNSRAAAGQSTASSATSEPTATPTGTTSPTADATAGPTAAPTVAHATKGHGIASSHRPAK